jgi:A/G-specific adenine glycosylase
VLPSSPGDLEGLPGIGPYTAAAISAIAFHRDVVAVDGNIRRVFARLINLELDARSGEGFKRILERATRELPAGRASQYNQALMDLGASICTPRNPQCSACPLASHCATNASGTQQERPVVSSRATLPRRRLAAGVITQNSHVLVGRRADGGLLGGLWGFPEAVPDGEEALDSCLIRSVREALEIEIADLQPLDSFDHSYTHFKVSVHAFEARYISGPRPRPPYRWTKREDLTTLPMGKIDRAIASIIQKGMRSL